MTAVRELRVGFNAHLLSSPVLRGWNRYTVNLLAALPGVGVRPILLASTPPHPEHLARLPVGSFEVRVAPRMSYTVFEQLWLAARCRADRLDVLHSPFNFGLPLVSACPRVLTLHDAIDEIYSLPRLARRVRWSAGVVRSRLTMLAARRRAHRVITVSEHARRDLIRHLGLAPRAVAVTPEAADPTFRRPAPLEIAAVARRYELPARYLFYVGGWEGRKNVPFLLRALAAAGAGAPELVLAGGGAECESLLMLAAELGIVGRVRMLGFVPDPDLPALYAGAEAFVYPSEYEGFGLQLVEAMAVGCPVMAARATSLPEVLGSGGETFSLDSTDELAGLIGRLADPTFRPGLVARATRRSADFSWGRTADLTAAVYRSLIPNRGQSWAW